MTRPPRDRLNLLFLWTDEQRPDTIGAYREAGRAAGGPGSPYAGAGPDTPHLDRLVAKGVQYEGASRVPLLFRIPGLAPRRIETPVSQVDVIPTLLDVLGLPVPPQVQGKSLLPLLRDGDSDPHGGEVVFEWSGARAGDDEAADGLRYSWADAAGRRAVAAQQRTIRHGRWKLTVDETGDHELYDLDADPDETRNLLHAPDAGALRVATDLWARLRAWQERTADPLTLAPDFRL